jgi:hypothetical protein
MTLRQHNGQVAAVEVAEIFCATEGIAIAPEVAVLAPESATP